MKPDLAPIAKKDALAGIEGDGMLSRTQEATVLEVLCGNVSGTARTYCLEHLAAAARVPPGHIGDLAALVRSLRMMGDCETRPSGFCDANRHETRKLLVWGRRTVGRGSLARELG